MEGSYLCCRIGKDNSIQEVHIFPVRTLTGEELRTAQEELSASKFDGILKGVPMDKSIEASITRNSAIHNITIHKDSSIKQVKAILCHVSPSLIFSYIYLYARSGKTFSTDRLYRDLKSNNKSSIPGARLKSLALDAGLTEQADSVTASDNYGYGSLVDLHSQITGPMDFPLGVQFEPNYSTPVNPNSYFSQSNLQSYGRDGDLLLGLGNIVNNVIYFVDYRDFPSIPTSYFPILVSNGINTFEEAEVKQEEFRDQSNQVVVESDVVQESTKINAINEIANSGQIDTGLLYTSGNISLLPESPFDLPLDIIFKNLHSTISRPLIKYNPGRRQEKIYRLFANLESKKGKKIPYLSKSLIFRLVKTLATERQLSIFVLTKTFPIVVNFFSDSSSSIAFKCDVPLNEQSLIALLKTEYNSIIDIINSIISSNGYTLPQLQTFTSSIVKFNFVNLEFLFDLPAEEDNVRALNCMSPVFQRLGSETVSSGIKLLYLRVANFSKMNTIDSFITNAINSGVSETELLGSLVSEYGFANEVDAKERLVDFVSQQQIVRDAFRSNRVKIQDNPGIKISLEPDSFTGKLRANVVGVDSINYVNFIEKYLRAYIRLTTESEAAQLGISKHTLLNLCASTPNAVNPSEQAPVIQPLNQGDNQVKAKFLDLLMSEDDTSDDEEQEDDTAEGVKSMNSNINIEGMKLLNPNPFSLMLQQREPILFKAKKDSGTYSYARACPSNNRRQPVILTAEEKERIDREHPGSYTKSLAYKSTPDGKLYYYVCPRYWDLKRKTSLTEEEVASGEYGEVIPQGARKVPRGTSVYEFDSEYHRDGNGNHIPLYPGFMKPKGHPQGKCVPCCFKSWDAPARMKLRKECSGELETLDEQFKFDDYVKGPEKWPLDEGRLGYLSPGLELFLGVENSKCQISKTDSSLRANTPCLVRFGVGLDKNTSFIAAIASALAEAKGKRKVSVESLVRLLADSCDLDTFHRLQNGALVSLFAPDSTASKTSDDKSLLSASVDKDNSVQATGFNKIKVAHERFIKYLRDPESVVDHKYLWDLVTHPNKAIFPRGINLIILEEPSSDITNDIRILCPSNPYKSKLYYKDRSTLVLYLKNGIYEVLVLYEDRKKDYAVTKLFPTRAKGQKLLSHIISIISTIQQISATKCLPLPSLPKIYEYSPGLNAGDTLNHLRFMNYRIIAEVLNYNGKSVGFQIERGPVSGYVPCQPSTQMIDKFDVIWLDDVTPQNYTSTTEFLIELNLESNGKLAIEPVGRIVEDSMNVAVITASNQAVMINPEPIGEGDPLPIINRGNPTGIDATILTSTSTDNDRVDAIQRINSETAFYNVFRNQVRLLLTSYTYSNQRQNLIDLLGSDLNYEDKLQKIANVIYTIIGDRVRFVAADSELLSSLRSKGLSLCNASDTECALVVPKINLINGIDNENAYFVKVADEFIRYTIIRDYLLSPDSFLSFDKMPYKLNEDEVILLQSLLDQSYFDDLVADQRGKFMSGRPYDLAEPEKSAIYSDKVEMHNTDPEMQSDGNNDFDCAKPVILRISGKWSKLFPTGSEELVFSADPPTCTFQPIAAILGKVTAASQDLNAIDVKHELIGAYEKMWPEFGSRILAVLSSEGKKDLVRRVKEGTTTISLEILSPQYACSSLDLWVLAATFNLPLVLYIAGTFKHTKRQVLPLHYNSQASFFFLKTSGYRNNVPIKYRLVIKGRKSSFELDTLGEPLRALIKDAVEAGDDNLDNYLRNFRPVKLKLVKEFSKSVRL